jgi:ribosomal-protein-alanine N-acetyltransferase
MTTYPTLQTARLQLREITEADAPCLLAIHSDAEHMKWFGADPLKDIEGAVSLINAFADWRKQPNPGTRWGIERKNSQGLIGTCGLFAWNKNWRKCSLGYELARNQTGHGFMDEALRTVLQWGFDTMSLHRIEAQVHPANASSLALLARLGFKAEGSLREVAYWGGCHHDLLQLSLLKSDWPNFSAVQTEHSMNATAIKQLAQSTLATETTLPSPSSAEAIVRDFWQLMGSNDFHAVKAVLSPELVVEWPQSKERIRGAENFARMNAEYPTTGRWHFQINRLLVNGDEVVTQVSVSDGKQSAEPVSFFTVQEGRIVSLVEYWPEPFAAAENRRHLVEPIY